MTYYLTIGNDSFYEAKLSGDKSHWYWHHIPDNSFIVSIIMDDFKQYKTRFQLLRAYSGSTKDNSYERKVIREKQLNKYLVAKEELLR